MWFEFPSFVYYIFVYFFYVGVVYLKSTTWSNRPDNWQRHYLVTHIYCEHMRKLLEHTESATWEIIKKFILWIQNQSEVRNR